MEKALSLIGKITKTRGLKGELVVSIDKQMVFTGRKIKMLWVENNGQSVPYFVEKINPQGDKCYIYLQDIDTIEKANLIVKHNILTETNTIGNAFAKNKYMQLSNYECYSSLEYTDDNYLGKILSVDMLAGQCMGSFKTPKAEMLLPLNPDFVAEINTEALKLVLTLPEGYIEMFS